MSPDGHGGMISALAAKPRTAARVAPGRDSGAGDRDPLLFPGRQPAGEDRRPGLPRTAPPGRGLDVVQGRSRRSRRTRRWAWWSRSTARRRSSNTPTSRTELAEQPRARRPAPAPGPGRSLSISSNWISSNGSPRARSACRSIGRDQDQVPVRRRRRAASSGLESPNAVKFEQFIFDALPPLAERHPDARRDRPQPRSSSRSRTATGPGFSRHGPPADERQLRRLARIGRGQGDATVGRIGAVRDREISPLFALDAGELKGKVPAESGGRAAPPYT